MADIEILSPFDGEAVELDQVPDPVFAQKMAGDGMAIKPRGEVAVAPVEGILVKVFPGGHAFVVSTPTGVDILVHVGLDTVELKGQGFTIVTPEGQTVQAGTPVVRFNQPEIERLGRNLISPIISISEGTVTRRNSGMVRAGKDVLFVVTI
jgi:sugar PTS system EIIA component